MKMLLGIGMAIVLGFALVYFLVLKIYPFEMTIFQPHLLFQGEKNNVVVKKTAGFDFSEVISIQPSFGKDLSFLELFENNNKFLHVEKMSSPSAEGIWFRYTLFNGKGSITVPDEHPYPARWLRKKNGDWEAKPWLSDQSDNIYDVDMQIISQTPTELDSAGRSTVLHDKLDIAITFLPKNYNSADLTFFNLWRLEQPYKITAKTDVGEMELVNKVLVKKWRYRTEKK